MGGIDIQQLKADIKAEVLKELTNKDYKAANSTTGPYGEIREKYKKPLLDKFGTYYFDQVWQHIRKLACYYVGVRYVRDLTPSKEAVAAECAETLCKMMLE